MSDDALQDYTGRDNVRASDLYGLPVGRKVDVLVRSGARLTGDLQGVTFNSDGAIAALDVRQEGEDRPITVVPWHAVEFVQEHSDYDVGRSIL